ncbi:MAG: glycosyl transferase family 2 [Parcubacteria group bacterium Licking1014_1]|nr:MAG: glycosyl transferase family 2 [Parcubacteria group bacterium Licking1014_1]
MNQKSYAIVIPVLNEEKRIEESVLELENFISSQLKNYQIKIIISDGKSADKTIEIVKKLQKNFANLYLKEIGRKGKGFQLKKTFSEEKADFFIQIDIDMATPLKYMKELIFWLENDYAMVIGSRFKKESKAKRSIHRKILGLGYSSLVRLFFKTSIMDYQCGFKGFNAKTIKPILPEIKNNEWIFDTELILRGLKKGLRIKEIPVEWEEKPGSKINILKHSFQMFFSLLKLRLFWRK